MITDNNKQKQINLLLETKHFLNPHSRKYLQNELIIYIQLQLIFNFNQK